MADNRMKNDDQRNMDTGGRDDQDWKQGQQAPGRNPQGGQQGGQQGGGQPGQQGGQRKDNLNIEDDEEVGGGQSGQRGGQGGQGGGQGRGGQNR